MNKWEEISKTIEASHAELIARRREQGYPWYPKMRFSYRLRVMWLDLELSCLYWFVRIACKVLA